MEDLQFPLPYPLKGVLGGIDPPEGGNKQPPYRFSNPLLLLPFPNYVGDQGGSKGIEGGLKNL